MIKVDGHISELLYEHDCVVVPELGGFLASYAPATLHPVQHTFVPPSRQIAFNEVLKQNDGLLAHHVAQTESLTYNQAQREISNFVDNCRVQLLVGKKFTIENIGTLFKNAEGSLQFEPAKNTNYLKDSFGLVNIQFLPIEQVNTANDSRLISRKSIPQEKPKTPVKFSRKKILNTVLIGAGTIWFCFNVYLITPSRFSESSLSPVPESVKVEPPAKAETVIIEPKVSKNNPAPSEAVSKENTAETTVTSAIKETSSEAKPVVPETKPQVIAESNILGDKFFLIGGAFRSEENATKFTEALKAEGFINARILSGQAQLKMVCYSGFATMEQAQAERSRLKSMQKDAWIYRD